MIQIGTMKNRYKCYRRERKTKPAQKEALKVTTRYAPNGRRIVKMTVEVEDEQCS